MKLLDFVSVFVRISGILMFVILLRDTPQWIAATDSWMAGSGEDRTIYYLMWFSCIAISLVMIKFPITISNWLVSKNEKDSPLLESDGEAIQIAGFTILGVYILSWAIPDLIHNAMMIWQYKKYAPDDAIGYTTFVINELVTVVEIAIALWLMVGAKGMLSLIKAMRR